MRETMNVVINGHLKYSNVTMIRLVTDVGPLSLYEGSMSVGGHTIVKSLICNAVTIPINQTGYFMYKQPEFVLYTDI